MSDNPGSAGECRTKRFSNPFADRTIFSEYHDWSSITGMFVLRSLRWKLVAYPGYEDQPFDMSQDHHEIRDLAQDPACAKTLHAKRRNLSSVLDVTQINARRLRPTVAQRQFSTPKSRDTPLHDSLVWQAHSLRTDTTPSRVGPFSVQTGLVSDKGRLFGRA